MEKELWLGSDKHGFKLWFGKPNYNKDVGLFFPEAHIEKHGTYSNHLYYISLPHTGQTQLEDIFIKLDGLPMEIGECIQVNLVEHFKGEGYDA